MKIKLFLSILLLSFASITSYASFPVSSYVANSENVSLSEDKVEEKVVMTSPAAAADRKTVSIILALVSVIFLPFALHNWYLGRNKQALWQTLLVIPGFILLLPPLVSWIWQIVDTIRILSGNSKFD